MPASHPERLVDRGNDITVARYKASKCYHGDVFFFFCAVVASAFEATITVVSDGPIPHAHQRCTPRSFRTDLFDGNGLSVLLLLRAAESWYVDVKSGPCVKETLRRFARASVCGLSVSSNVSCVVALVANALRQVRRPSSRAINVIREIPRDKRTTLTTACRIEWN